MGQGGIVPPHYLWGVIDKVGQGGIVPPHYLWGGTDTPRLWFIKLKGGRGGAPEALERQRPTRTRVALAL